MLQPYGHVHMCDPGVHSKTVDNLMTVDQLAGYYPYVCSACCKSVWPPLKKFVLPRLMIADGH